MRPCPEGTRKAWRELQRGKSPCVVWAPGAVEDVFTPDSAAAERMCRVRVRRNSARTVSHAQTLASRSPPLTCCHLTNGSSTPQGESGGPLEVASETGGPFGAYLDCAARHARGVARAVHGSAKWGLFVVSDSPALKCVAESSRLGRAGHVLVTPTAWGHVQYAECALWKPLLPRPPPTQSCPRLFSAEL